jgi:hypothetical protein
MEDGTARRTENLAHLWWHNLGNSTLISTLVACVPALLGVGALRVPRVRYAYPPPQKKSEAEAVLLLLWMDYKGSV